MTCHHKDCTLVAEFVKLGTDAEGCAAHLPDGDMRELMAFLEGDTDRLGDWIHVDGSWKCVGCGLYFADEHRPFTCEVCKERVCVDCDDEHGVCAACRDSAAERSEVREVIRRA